jgi:hypothetical protein
VLVVLFAALLSLEDRAGAAEEVYVAQDDTPIFAAPSEDAEVLLRPNAGHRLIVLERRDAWLKVRSPQHMVVGKEMWVQADKVGPPPPKRAQPAPEQGPVYAPQPGFLLEANGTPGLDIRTSCRIVEAAGGPRRLRELTELLPAAYEFAGTAISCLVQKLDDLGRLEVALSDQDGTLIATAETAASFGSVRVRSAGPWGEADASRGPSRLFLLGEDPHFRLRQPPTGMPVPPFTSPPVPSFTSPPVSSFTSPPVRSFASPPVRPLFRFAIPPGSSPP